MTCSDSEPLIVCVVSTTSAAAVGGLTTYARYLTQHLAAQAPTTAIARFATDGSRAMDYAAAETPRTLRAGDGSTLQIIAAPRVLRPLAAIARRLVHRPRTQRLAVALFVCAYGPAVARAVPRDTALVHWVGSGWELLGFAALRAARRRGAAFTVLPAIHEGSWGDSPLDGRLYAAADRVLALSRTERMLLERLGVQGARIDETGLGPGVGDEGDGAAFRARHELGDRPIALFIGRKERGKGYHALCEAVERVVRFMPELAFVAIGSPGPGPAPAAPAALVDLGSTDDREKADALAACDVLCLPSSRESFGIVYVEAWQYGKPVVVGPSRASRDLVEHGVTGLHVDQHPDEIASALLTLLRDPARAASMGAAGRALQRERYTWAATSLTHAQTFERAVASRTGGARST